MLRQLVEKNWTSIALDERAQVRSTLPATLHDDSATVRSSGAAVIAMIATQEWPKVWPEVIDGLLECLQGRQGDAAAHGAVCAFEFLMGDGNALVEEQWMALGPPVSCAVSSHAPLLPPSLALTAA